MRWSTASVCLSVCLPAPTSTMSAHQTATVSAIQGVSVHLAHSCTTTPVLRQTSVLATSKRRSIPLAISSGLAVILGNILSNLLLKLTYCICVILKYFNVASRPIITSNDLAAISRYCCF